MPHKLELVADPAGKRLGSTVHDWLAPVTVLTVLPAAGCAGTASSRSGGFMGYTTSSLVLFGGIGAGLTLIYLAVLTVREIRSGGAVLVLALVGAAAVVLTTPDDTRTDLAAWAPTRVRPSSTVHLGDRSLYLGQA